MPDDSFKQFEKYLSNVANSIQGELEKTIKLCCQKVRSDIQDSMAKTPRDTTKTYYTNNKTKGHNPSLPGNPPAPDTGNLRNSIRYEVYGSGTEVYGIIGTTQKNPPYGTYLEYGTSKMAPRPWLRPAMLRNNDWIKKMLKQTVANKLKEAEK